jgi:integrase
MPKTDKPPSYRKHRQSGQAIVTLRDGQGRKHDHLLGKYGSPESRTEYARLIQKWELNRRSVQIVREDLTVNELVVAFDEHAAIHYRRPDGTPTGEIRDYKLSLRPMLFLYGPSLVTDFDVLALQNVRRLMIDGYLHPKHGKQPPLARQLINQRIDRIKRVFKWGVSQKKVPGPVWTELTAVRGLQRGRSEAKETERILPVDENVVEATIPFVAPQVAAMIRLQLLTGMRSGEVVVMRGIDVDTAGRAGQGGVPLWFYRPGSDQGAVGQHKTAHHGHDRVIRLGPRAQAIIKQWLRDNPAEFLFQPAEAVDAHHAARKADRQSKMPPSQAKRQRKEKPQIKPSDHYTTDSYGKAINRGVDRANRGKKPGDKMIPSWHPLQLRHATATKIREHPEFGLDAAQAVLGHMSRQVTERYAEVAVTKADQAMAKMG